MLTIRLQRAGKKNRADYRVVLAEKTAASQKKFTEVLGSYNPHTKALNIRSQDRLNYWVDEQHVEISATVRNLLVTKELIKGAKTKAFTIPKKEVVEEPVAETPAAAEAPTEETPPTDAAPEAVAETPVAEEAPAVEATAEPVAEESAAPEVSTEAPAEVTTPETQTEAPAAPAEPEQPQA